MSQARAQAKASKSTTKEPQPSKTKQSSLSFSTAIPSALSARRKSSCACGGGCPSCNTETKIQPKLKIGAVGDRYEQEADRVTEQVMHMPELAHSPKAQSAPELQRKCCQNEEEEKIQPKPLSDSITPLVQAKSGTEPQNEVSQPLHNRIYRSQGRGKKIDTQAQSFMENRFGADFSQVRVHTGSNAIQMNQQLNAQAFTLGSDIYFNEGKYAPSNRSGQYLLAHELTHILQQTGAKRIQRFVTCESSTDCPSREVEEHRVARLDPMVAVPIPSGETGIVVDGFDINSAAIKSTLASSPTWTSFTTEMGTNVDLSWEILGFTDCQGSESLNMDLRTQRAQALRNALPAPARARISSQNAAPITNCVYSNTSSFGRKMNRSAVIRLVQTTLNFEQGTDITGNPCAQTFTGLDCSDPTFCTPYTTNAEIRAAKGYLLGTFVPILEGYFGSEVGALWRRYLSRKRGDSLTPIVYNSARSSIYRSFSWNNHIIDEVDNVLDIIASRLSRGYGNVTQPLSKFLDRSDMNLSTNFSNLATIPGNIAGGISGSDAGRDSRKITWGRVSFDITNLPLGKKLVEIEAFVNFEVKDAIDFCPGGCGAPLEQRLATIKMSRLEASCEAYDAPFVVRFPGPRRTKTVID